MFLEVPLGLSMSVVWLPEGRSNVITLLYALFSWLSAAKKGIYMIGIRSIFRKIAELSVGLTALAVLFIAGCGGGGGSGLGALVIEGIAAVGTPITSGNISVVCAAGSAVPATTTDPTTGAYSVTLSGQTLPCAVQVSGGAISGLTNTTLSYRSIATATGTTNVNPLTELIVANATGLTPSTWFAGVSSVPSALSGVGSTQVNNSVKNVANALAGLSPLQNNPITTTMTASASDPFDDSLTALATVLSANNISYTALLSDSTLPTFASIVAASGINTQLTTALYNTQPSGTTNGGVAYSGNYSGTFNGSVSGTWQVNVASNGNMTGTITPQGYAAESVSSGTINSSGNVSVGTTSGGYSFTGAISTNAIPWTFSGTWNGGSFTGTKQ
jgi:hypothetical protein